MQGKRDIGRWVMRGKRDSVPVIRGISVAVLTGVYDAVSKLNNKANLCASNQSFISNEFNLLNFILIIQQSQPETSNFVSHSNSI
jgi:hypothetical protein